MKILENIYNSLIDNMKIITLVFIGMLPTAAFATPLGTLDDKEISGGAECVITNAQGRVLIENNQIKINGALVKLQTISLTERSKTWSAENLEVNFKLTKGKMLETTHDGFTVGKSPMGKLNLYIRVPKIRSVRVNSVLATNASAKR